MREGWRDTTLGCLGTLSTSGVDKKSISTERRVRLVNYMDVYRHNFISRSLDLMPVTATDSEKLRFQVRKTDILFTPSSETPDDIGHAAVVVDDLPDVLHSYHTVRLRLDDGGALDLRFSGWLGHANQVRSHFATRATGSTRYTLTLGDFAAAPVRLPPLPEQRQIAAILDTLDEAISKTEATIAKLKQVKQGLLHDLLTRGIDENGELRDPERHPEHFKESPLGRIPKEWQIGELESFQVRLIDGDRGSEYPNGSDFSAQGYCLFLSAQNVTKDGFRFVDTVYISKQKDSRLSKGRLERDDIVVTTRGTLGNFAHFDVSVPFDVVRINSGMVIIRNDEPRLQTPFLYQMCRSSLVQRQIETSAYGSAQPQLNLNLLGSLLVVVPPLLEQQNVLKRSQALESRIRHERDSLWNFRLVKHGLAEDLLTGRVRVTNLLEEAAE